MFYRSSRFCISHNHTKIPYDVNDKIMCIKNDKENQIFNGEFGRVTAIDKTTFRMAELLKSRLGTFEPEVKKDEESEKE